MLKFLCDKLKTFSAYFLNSFILYWNKLCYCVCFFSLWTFYSLLKWKFLIGYVSLVYKHFNIVWSICYQYCSSYHGKCLFTNLHVKPRFHVSACITWTNCIEVRKDLNIPAIKHYFLNLLFWKNFENEKLKTVDFRIICKYYMPFVVYQTFFYLGWVTAWKVFVFGVFLVRIQSKCGEIRIRKTPNTGDAESFHRNNIISPKA